MTTNEKPNALPSLDETREDIRDDVDQTARWRSQKAEQYPLDDRNTRAVVILRAVGASFETLTDDLVEAFLKGKASAWNKGREEYWQEGWSAHLRSVGFGYAPKTLAQLVDDFHPYIPG